MGILNFGEGFPYSNFHDLNMDWIIKIAKDFLDQYTHIQEVIVNGEESLENLTTSGLDQLDEKTSDGLTQLQEKADNLEELLQAWYDDHSQDIADQLADALADLNEWYSTHENYLDNTLAENIASFNSSAEAKSQALLDSWPDDYSELVEGYNYLKSACDTLRNNLNLLQDVEIHENAYYNAGETSYNGYSYFIIPVVSGQSYITATGARFLSKESELIGQMLPAGYRYTADFTGNLYITLSDDQRENWKVYNNIYSADIVPVYDNVIPKTDIGFDSYLLSPTSKSIKNRYDKYINKNNLLQESEFHENMYYNAGESLNTNYSYFIIPVTSGNKYIIGTKARYISKESSLIVQNVSPFYVYTADFTGNLYITLSNEDRDNWKVYSDNTNPADVPAYDKYVANYLDVYDKYVNKGNILQSVVIHENAYYSTSETAHINYSYFIIPITSGEKYVIGTSARYISKESEVIAQSTPAGYVYTADFSGDLYVTLSNSDRNAWRVFDQETDANTIPPYDFYAMNSVNQGNVSAKSTLTGKVWYACGDSFTAGDFTGYSGQTQFTDSPYLGEKMVYPFFIGRRTGMTVHNLAVTGMTMAVRSGSDNNFINTYQSVGSDADYITIKLGINDSGNSIPIGNITDTSTDTFYGAYNTVMTWLIENRPTAKIGIIVPNGLSEITGNNYAEAIINIAKKYGVPYLNEWNGEQVPVLIRSGRTDIDASIKTIRNNTFKCSNNNSHPNPICEEYESTFIEAWLMTL